MYQIEIAASANYFLLCQEKRLVLYHLQECFTANCATRRID